MSYLPVSKIKRLQILIVTLFVAILMGAIWYVYQFKIGADQVDRSEEFGVHAALPALKTIAEKQKAIDKIAEAGFGWVRHEFYYEPLINFENYDTVQRLTKAKGLKALGILSYPGKDKSHEEWKRYVNQIAGRYANDVAAWQIMNEIDSESYDLTPSAYTEYLKEASVIIRALNPGATIVLSGTTSRPQAAAFWEGIGEAGGFEYFDTIGLHHYHGENPENIRFGSGDFETALSRPLSTIRKYGADKKIWVTETGYIEGAGLTNQAKWLARSMIIARAIPEVEKVFIYRLTNKSTDYRYGLLDEDFNEYPVYQEVKKVIQALRAQGAGKRLQIADRQERENFDTLSGWRVSDTREGEARLSLSGGPDGTAMQIDYRFMNGQAYVLVEKKIELGQPQAIGSWFYGGDDNNIVKGRFVDSKGETFQFDLGTVHSAWQYKQFTLGTDTALVSWNGDNKIDYPIYFHSYVIDRQGGKDQGTLKIDELTTIESNADLFAYQFDNKVAYWKTMGGQEATICGKPYAFTDQPEFTDSSECSDRPKIASLPSPSPKIAISPSPVALKLQSSPSPSPSPLPTLPPPIIRKVDPSQSVVELVGTDIPANGYQSYRLNITLKDEEGHILPNVQPILQIEDKVEDTNTIGPLTVNNSWIVAVSANRAGQYTSTVLADNQVIKKVSLPFTAPPVEKPTRSVPVLPLGAMLLFPLIIAFAIITYHGYYHKHSQPLPALTPLIRYIWHQFGEGKKQHEITTRLLNHGWPREVIDAAFQELYRLRSRKIKDKPITDQ